MGVPGSGFRDIKQGLCCSSGGERNDFKKIRHKVVVVVKTGAGPARDTEGEPWEDGSSLFSLRSCRSKLWIHF